VCVCVCVCVCERENLIRHSDSPLAVSVKQGSDIVLMKSLFTTEHKRREMKRALNQNALRI